jgi:hypothetical protein
MFEPAIFPLKHNVVPNDTKSLFGPPMNPSYSARLRLFAICLLSCPWPMFAINQANAPQAVIQNGKALCRIVLSDRPTEIEEESAQKLAHYLERAGGARVLVQRESEAARSTGASVAIYIGAQEANARVGLKPEELPEETFAIKTLPGAVHIVGRDTFYKAPAFLVPMQRSPATKWAVNYLAEKSLGVRWLWPGELGTFIPKAVEISIPPLNLRYTPPLQQRTFRRAWPSGKENPPDLFPPEVLEKERDEAHDWMENHQLADRFRKLNPHAFTNWWKKYSTTHPDIFAQPPAGYQQPFPSAKSAKLRLANPELLDVIEKVYTDAGQPDFWNVGPNDGVGFDTSPETRAWDIPREQDPVEIWMGKGQLTARYVQFWNRVYERLSALNSGVTLGCLAYGCYRNPPPPEVKLTAKMVIVLVPAYSTDLWKGWAEAMDEPELILRPNWWHSGPNAPYLPLTEEGEFIRFAARHGMIGVNMDSINGFWGVQGVRYYVAARLLQDPERTVDSIVAEYCSAFGAAGDIVREYFDYWEQYSKGLAYPVAAGGVVSLNPEGLYEKAAAANGVAMHPILGSTAMLPFLFPDAALERGREILGRAQAAVEKDEDPSFAERVRFLQQGLDEVQATRDVLVADADYRKDRTAEKQAAYMKKAEELLKLRRELTRKGWLWGDVAYAREIRRGNPTLPTKIPEEVDENMDGM